MQSQNLDTFMTRYAANLALVVMQYPQEYAWPVADVPTVAARMRAAFERNSYNLDGRAIKMTCKQFKIKPTRTAINAFLNGGTA